MLILYVTNQQQQVCFLIAQYSHGSPGKLQPGHELWRIPRNPAPYSPVLQGPNTWRGQGQGTLVHTSLYSNCTPLACHALLVYHCKFCGTLVYGNVIGTWMFLRSLLIIFYYSTIFKAHRRLYGLQDSHFWVLKLMGKSEPESKQNKGWMVGVYRKHFSIGFTTHHPTMVDNYHGQFSCCLFCFIYLLFVFIYFFG